nr:hypothetical protein [Ahrensia marina]
MPDLADLLNDRIGNAGPSKKPGRALPDILNNIGPERGQTLTFWMTYRRVENAITAYA